MPEKKLSKSKISEKHLSVKSSRLPKDTEKKLSEASRLAGNRIAYNNQVYAVSGSHAPHYIVNERGKQ